MNNTRDDWLEDLFGAQRRFVAGMVQWMNDHAQTLNALHGIVIVNPRRTRLHAAYRAKTRRRNRRRR